MDPSQWEPFLCADRSLCHDPFLLPDLEKAVGRIRRALVQREGIAVYGDFDADGVCGTALLAQGLCALGGRVVPYIPHRFREGYGLNSPALATLAQQGISLVITADCGVTGHHEVAEAQAKGLDIIITDHHTPLPELPRATAVIDPKRADSAYPFRELAGVGVAFKLLQGLQAEAGGKGEGHSVLDLVALGTVADLMPLLDENRYLVKEGLKVLREGRRLGLRQMAEEAGLPLNQIDGESISFVLGPRLNAAGRLEHAMASYRLLVTDSAQEATELATYLGTKNEERRRLTNRVLAQAKAQLSPEDWKGPLLLVGGEDFPAGVVGVVAGKLAEEFYRPAVVLELGPEVSRGSARSIPEFNLIAALTQCRDLFLRLGGHAHAAGFTLPTARVGELKKCLLEIAAKELAGVELYPSLTIDAAIPLSQLNPQTLPWLEKMAPFGPGNPPPCFLSRQVRPLEIHPLGPQGEHLSLKLRSGSVTWRAVGFGLGSEASRLRAPLDIVYTLGTDNWAGGPEALELNLLDVVSSPPV